MRKIGVERPAIADLLPTDALARAFEEKTAAYEAGRLVRELRLSAGLTQRTLADRLDISQARVSAIESGEGTDGPTFGLLKRIVMACGFAWQPRFTAPGQSRHLSGEGSDMSGPSERTEAVDEDRNVAVEEQQSHQSYGA